MNNICDNIDFAKYQGKELQDILIFCQQQNLIQKELYQNSILIIFFVIILLVTLFFIFKYLKKFNIIKKLNPLNFKTKFDFVKKEKKTWYQEIFCYLFWPKQSKYVEQRNDLYDHVFGQLKKTNKELTKVNSLWSDPIINYLKNKGKK